MENAIDGDWKPALQKSEHGKTGVSYYFFARYFVQLSKFLPGKIVVAVPSSFPSFFLALPLDLKRAIIRQSGMVYRGPGRVCDDVIES